MLCPNTGDKIVWGESDKDSDNIKQVYRILGDGDECPEYLHYLGWAKDPNAEKPVSEEPERDEPNPQQMMSPLEGEAQSAQSEKGQDS